MSESPAIIWSNTDYPYICLIDKKRTLAFRDAIKEVVKTGDIVVEVGAGTGILSLFAVEAGASQVYAVEIDPVLAKGLRTTVHANHYEDKIKIIEVDALMAKLPKNVDVIIGELIETGLLDEMQVAVMNGLHKRGIIGKQTKLIPQSYDTYLQLVDTDHTFYGYHIAAPKHDWPYYSEDAESWEQLLVKPVSEIQKVGHFDFQAGLVEPKVDTIVDFIIPKGQSACAFRLSGAAGLTDTKTLGACNSFSGDKILPLPETLRGKIRLKVSYSMGAGLDDLKVVSIS